MITEVHNAKLRIFISFDGWGLKNKKLSVLGVIIHFINDKYKAVTCLIGLLELLDYRKANVGT